jgi:hypothetical protein
MSMLKNVMCDIMPKCSGIHQPVPLDRDWKFMMMEGANFHPVEILALVCCSSVRDFSCSEGRKKVLRTEKIYIGGNI